MRFPLDGFSFNPENKRGLELHSADGSCSLAIRPKRPNEDALGYRLGLEARLLCTVPCEPNQIDFISSFLQGTWKLEGGGAKPPLHSHGRLAVDENGEVKEGVSVWLDWFPPDIRELVESSTDAAWEHFLHALRLIRWRQNSPMQLPARSDLALPYWRVSNESQFYPIPQKSSVRHASPDVETGWISWTNDDAQGFHQLWSAPNVDEPLGQELQNEAEFLSERAPRSALLMATSGVEAGLKEHIGKVAPQTAWLLSETPSPPISKLLRKYIPLIHEGNSRLEIWQRAAPLFKKFEESVVRERNVLAHIGKIADHGKVRQHIRCTRDILYLIDYMDGHDWVLEQLSPETRKILGLPMLEDLRWIEIQLISGPELGS